MCGSGRAAPWSGVPSRPRWALRWAGRSTCRRRTKAFCRWTRLPSGSVKFWWWTRDAGRTSRRTSGRTRPRGLVSKDAWERDGPEDGEEDTETSYEKYFRGVCSLHHSRSYNNTPGRIFVLGLGRLPEKLWPVPVYSFVRITPPRRRRSNKPNGDVPPCWRHSSCFRCVGCQNSKGRLGPHFVASWCQGTMWSSVEGPRAVQWQLENTFVEQCCRHHHHLPSCDSLILQRKKFRTTFFSVLSVDISINLNKVNKHPITQ